MGRPDLRVLRRGKERGDASAEPVSLQQLEGSFQALATELQQFREERDWSKFHTPRNLATSISIEAGELLEHFQWLVDNHSQSQADLQLDAVGEELADVAIYVVQLAQVLGLSLAEAIVSKIQLNGEKYPVASARGSSLKYSELSNERARARSSA